MAKKISVLIIFIIVAGCTNPIQLDSRIMASNFGAFQDPVKSKTESKEVQNAHYLYQITKYDQAFLNRVSEFKNVHWELETNTTFIELDNQEEIIVTQKGLDYYSLKIDWSQNNAAHKIDDISHWLTQCKWLYERLLTPNDLAEFNEICAAKNYHITLDGQTLKISFTNHEFSEWFLNISQKDPSKTSISTGYYYK